MIGNNTILGFFVAIVDDDKFEKIVNRFWSKVPPDPFYNRNIVRDRENNEIRYNPVEPNTGGRKIKDELIVLKLEEYVREIIIGNYERSISQIEKKVEKLTIKELQKNIRFLREQLFKIKSQLPSSEVADLVPDITNIVNKIDEEINSHTELFNYEPDKRELISEFTKEFISDSRTKMSYEAVFKYITLFEKHQNESNFAKISKNKLDELGLVYTSGGALSSMKKKWVKFRDSRTAE